MQPVGNPRLPRHPEGERQFGNFADPAGGFGPEIGLARHLARSAAPGAPRLGIVKVAYGATNLRVDWRPGTPGGACYRALREETQAAIQAAREAGHAPRLRGLVWIQGEAEATRLDARACRKRLEALIAAIRRDLDCPRLPVLLGFNTRCFLGANPSIADVVAAQKAVAREDPFCVYVDTSAASLANEYHWDGPGSLDVGTWFAEALLQAEAAETP